MTIKEIAHDGTTETEVVVSDFDETNRLLGKLGHTPKAYQENKRTSLRLDDVELEIDEWPRIPPYLETEAGSKATVVATAARLGYGVERLTGENTTKVYARYGIRLADIADLRFAAGMDD